MSDIRHEAQGPRKKSIHLHFVTSNVPDLDDEDQILETRMRRFRESLGYDTLSGIIHHYNSLALLNQIIFTRERPRSRLAQEYRDLVQAVVRHNPEDREGVLDFLREVTGRTYPVTHGMSATALEERLDAIRISHEKDGEIAYRLANIRYSQGRFEEVLVLINNAVDNGYRNPQVLLQRAELYRLHGDQQHALADIMDVLDTSEATYFNVRRAIRLLRDLKSRSPETRA